MPHFFSFFPHRCKLFKTRFLIRRSRLQSSLQDSIEIADGSHVQDADCVRIAIRPCSLNDEFFLVRFTVPPTAECEPTEVEVLMLT